jgi:rhodanese-related sulfurtransferase
MTTGVDALLANARRRLRRLGPAQAQRAAADGALLVDIRPVAQRAEHGEVPGALVIDRNVLEWRLDPSCEARLPIANSYDRQIVLLCQEGYASSLAAAALVEIGLRNATDVIGGYCAWREAGLPTGPLAPPTEA